MLAHEAYHYLSNKKIGGKFEVAIKMDLRKVYDRVEWDFLEAVLLAMGFHSVWVARVMECVCSVRYNLLLAGNRIASFCPSRGLRLGDPLSPCIFILISDVLSKMITKACDDGLLRGIRMARRCPQLTHFAA